MISTRGIGSDSASPRLPVGGAAMILFVALAALHPASASACTCGGDPRDLATQLTEVRRSHRPVYVARVMWASERTLEALQDAKVKADLKVLEVFAGSAERGATLSVTLKRGCTLDFETGKDYLVYAESDPTDIPVCSRTRQIKNDDLNMALELAWFRTGKLPPGPVAMQREDATQPSTWGPVEDVRAAVCNWSDLANPQCRLTEDLAPLKEGRPSYPRLLCTPIDPDARRGKRRRYSHSCRLVEEE